MSPSLKEAIEFDKRIDAINEKLGKSVVEPPDKKLTDLSESLDQAFNIISKQMEEVNEAIGRDRKAKQEVRIKYCEGLRQELESLLTARNALLYQTANQLD